MSTHDTFESKPRRRWSWPLVGLAALVPVMPLAAQDGRSSARGQIVVRQQMNKACASLLNQPTDMVRTPEGLMLLRLKKEFDGVANLVEQRGAEAVKVDVRKLNDAQRGVDSLMQVFVRYRQADGTLGSTVTVRRGDSARGGSNPQQNRIIVETIDENLHALKPSFEFSLRDLASQFSTFAAVGAQAVNRATQTGYMGISLSGSQMRLITDSGSFTAHCDLPMIETVDVGSPARKAGLEAGDTVLAYNGRDIMAQAINYPQLLTPGNVVKVRIRREGKSRDVPVTVAERPAEIAEYTFRTAPGAPQSGGSVFIQRAPSNMSVTVRGGDAPGVTTNSWSWEMPSMNAIAGSATMATILGAQLNAVDDEFAQRLGLEPGVLVLSVQAGSPSAEAGLKPGEMIRAVNGVPVRELAPIRRAITVSGVRDVKLTVTGRDTPARIVTVRW